ncbi:hypothetical protein PMAA_029400 [Talaromyces marneffei ATCC 18224]|uniref:Uncharacterized protein n=1 Tax=Talaromyces marneffei (strain ATCC 18224 / CBS 334.59 / QM 7333) TaxID=441960 RepID=B6Q3N3_TALMQ|nr:hypothetical protein PMAA_029400 [Talaromyces marneffei ATCC 18224]
MGTIGQPSSGLIRTFSDELQERGSTNPLGRGLAAKVALDRHHEEFLTQQWDILLSDARELPNTLLQDDHVVLLDQSRRLKSLPQYQDMEVDLSQRPDIKCLIDTVSKAASTWQEDRERSKSGRLKEKFSKLCENCQNHSKLLSVIPSQDKYISLLTGSLSAIAQASINHKNIAEGVVKGLDELSKDIEFWNRQMEEHGDIKMLRQYIQELYVVVFEAFTDIFTSWSKSSWKRFLTSFDEGAFTKLFTARRGRIEAIERRIQQEITLAFQRKTRMSLQKLVADQEKLLALVPQELEQQRYLLGASIQKFLEEQLQSAQPLSRPSSTLVLSSSSQAQQLLITEPDALPQEDNTSPMTLYDYDRAEVASVIHEYVDLFKLELRELVNLSSYAPHLLVERQVHRQLTFWLQDFSSRNLWIQGPHGVTKPSQNSMTAVSIVALSHENNIPTVSYFCSLSYDNNPQLTRRDALRSMLTSIIAQFVLFLPARGSTSMNLSPARFSSIAQNTPSIDVLLQLIRDLRKAGPRYLHCVIDSIQILEERSDPVYTKDLLLTIATFCDLAYDAPPQNHEDNDNEALEHSIMITKTCFTTDGIMDGLSQAAEIDIIEKVDFGVEANDGTMGESTSMRF